MSSYSDDKDLISDTEPVGADKVRGDNLRLLAAVNDAVASMGLGTAAGACGVKPNVLRGALDGAGGRHFPTEWAAIIAARVGDGVLSNRIRQAIKALFGLHEPDTDPQYIHRLEQGYGAFGAIGGAELARHRRESRR